MRPRRMVRLLIAGSKDRLDAVVGTLQTTRLVHLIDFHGDGEETALKPGAPGVRAESVSADLTKVRSCKSHLGVDGGTAPSGKGLRCEGAVREGMPGLMRRIDDEIARHVSRRTTLHEMLTSANKEREALAPFIELGVRPALLSGYESVFVFVGTSGKDFTTSLDKVVRSYEMFGRPGDPRRLFALFVDKVDMDEAARVLEENGFSSVKVPEPSVDPETRCRELDEEMASIEKERTEIDSTLSRLGKEMAEAVLQAEEVLEVDVERTEAPMRFATTDNAFIVTGWVPADDAKRFEKEVRKAAGDGVYMEFEVPNEGDDVPIAADNPPVSRPFEVLRGLMGLPSYQELDPSVLMAIGIPLFFGFMLGDIGYGLVLLALVATGVWGKMLEFFGMGGARRQLTFVIVLCAISSIVFGFLFNEFFGFELMEFSAASGEGHILLPSVNYPEFAIFVPLWGVVAFPVSRIDEAMTLLVVTLVVGIVHIALGLLIGLRNVWVSHGPKHAILEKGSWLLILLGGAFVIGYFLTTKDGEPPYDGMSIWMVTGVPMLVAGLGMLLLGEGPLGLVHVFNLMSNTLSYARLMAIGISSVAIAMVFNTLALEAFDGGGNGIVVGVVLLIVGHTINLLLGILGSTLHGLRLHLVEFFIKFYDGSGKPFEPFGRPRTYTTSTDKGGNGRGNEGHDDDVRPQWGIIEAT